jgi:hypothetical protein
LAQTAQNPSATNSGSMATNPNAGAVQGSTNPSASTTGTNTTSVSSPTAGATVGTSSGSSATPEANPPASAPTGVSTPTTASPGAISAKPDAPSPLPSTTLYNDPSTPKQPERRVAGDPLEPPPLPKTDPTLIGGIVQSVDRVRNHITLQPFGGKKMKLSFDERTRFFRNGVETTFAGVKKGDRIYVDTQLDGATVFARNVRVRNEQEPADARGQVVSINGGRIGLRDELSGQTVNFIANGNTKVVKGGEPATLNDVKEGSLVNVKFTPDRGDRGAAQEIALIAAPGDVFTFQGKVTHLDLSRGVLAIQNARDNRNYEVNFDPNSDARDELGIGQDVTVSAMFDGTRYMAKNVSVNKTAESREQ